MKKQSDLQKLFGYAGKFKILTVLSWILSVVSAFLALLPFVYIWRILKEVLDVAPDYAAAENLSYYGWMAVLFAVLSMVIYIGALLCSHIAAFRVQANIRSRIMHHIATLPLGVVDDVGSGKMRKTVNETSAATETYLAHMLPDMAGAYATPVGLLILLLVFDWRLGLLSLIPVVIAFAIMVTMTGKRMQVKIQEYQNALDSMSNEAVEYVRGAPVVKIFGQSIFSFKRFKKAIDTYEKWVIAYTKDLRIPMTIYTTIINGVFAVLIAAALVMTREGVTNTFLLNLLFYVIITPIITVILNKIMFSSENKLIVADAMERIDKILVYLSGGECQRISIARAILKNAPILILDEATAFADPDNEAKVQAALSALSHGKTVLMIAHRLSTVTSTDKIYVIRDGKIAQQGSHEELCRGGGLYADMWEQYNMSANWKVGEANA